MTALPSGSTAGLVRRRRLDDLLNLGTSGPVTLVSATAGSGKTSAVASWAGSADAVVCWLTLDGTDKDLPSFWTDVLRSLGAGGALWPGSALAGLVPLTGFGPPELEQIQQGLAALPQPVVLLLDDFQVLDDEFVLESVRQMLRHQLTNLRLVIVTRVEPAIGLAELRATGDVTDIGSRELAFTEAEAAELFDRSDVHLPPLQVRMLLERTLGWSAGLRMAALTLGAADPDQALATFTGASGVVAGYLNEEVLDQLPTAEREFLLATSVTQRLQGELADLLSDRTDSRVILEKLVDANAFVVRFGGQGEWFGYHPLLRELLQRRLTIEHPDRVRLLHRRAAQWYEANDEPIEAIRHAVQAADWTGVQRIMLASIQLLFTPDGPALAAVLEPVAERSATDPGLVPQLAAAVGHFVERDYRAMRQDVVVADEFLRTAPIDVRPAAAAVIALAHVAHARGLDLTNLVPAANRLLELIDQTPRRQLKARRHYRVLAVNNAAGGQLWSGEFGAAEAGFTNAIAGARALGMELPALNGEGHLALLDVMHGRLRRGHRRAVSTLRSLDRRGWGSQTQSLAVHLTLAVTHLCWNQPELAAAHIERGLAASLRATDAGCRLALSIAAVRLAVARGNVGAIRVAEAQLQQEMSRSGGVPDLLARCCATARADALLAVGDATTALAEIAPSDGPSDFAASLERLVAGRAHLVLGRPQTALDMLGPMLGSWRPYLPQSVEARVLAAAAMNTMGRLSDALAAIAEAVGLAEQEGLVGPFTAGGSHSRQLLVHYRTVAPRHRKFTDQILATGG